MIGGAGFIGRHLVDCLLKSGREVLVIGRTEAALVSLTREALYLQGDIRNREFLARALDGVDEVIDLAYSSVPKTSFENPLLDITDNLPGSVGLFGTASELPIRKMIFVSSGGTVYGEPVKTPIPEDHPTNPISPYGITKLALEKYAQMYHKIRGLPVVCVRPSNPYGEGQKAFVGQGFVATAMVSVLQGREISIFGREGTIRDYIHVEDLATGLLAALDFGKPGETYNIGSSQGKTNLEVIGEISRNAEKCGLHPVVVHAPPRSFDVSANVLDTRKLFELSGWRPQTTFEEGIRRTWDWYHKGANG